MFNLALKDYAIAKKVILQSLVMIAGVSVILSVAKDFNHFIVFYFLIYFTFSYIFTLFSIEEKENSIGFVMILPLSSLQIVGARFLSLTGLLLSITLISGGLNYISAKVMYHQIITFDQIMFFGTLALFLCTLLSSVLIPLMYRLGYTSASNVSRMVLLTFLLVPVAAKLSFTSNMIPNGLMIILIDSIDFLKSMSYLHWSFILSALSVIFVIIALTLSQAYFRKYTTDM